MLLGLVLFFAFSTYYLQHTHTLEPLTFRLILSSHAALYVLSSFILAPIVAAHSERLLPIGVTALFAIYTLMYLASSVNEIPLPVFLACVLTMSTLYGALYGPSIQKTLQSITRNPGLATSMLGTLQFTSVSIITTFAFSSGAAQINQYVLPLIILSGLSMFLMMYYRKSA